MKYILITFLGLIYLALGCNQNAPEAYSIKGTFDNSIQADSIFVYSGSDIIARALIVNNAFELNGSVPEPVQVTLYTRVNGEDPDGMARVGRLILENTDYTLVYENKNSKIKGGKLHDLVLAFESSDEYQSAVNEYEKVTTAIFNNKDDGYEPTTQEKDLMREKTRNAIDIENRELTLVIESDKSPVLAKAFALSRIQDWEGYSLDRRLTLFDKYKSESKSDEKAIEKLRLAFADMKQAEESGKTVGIGKPFKDIEAKDDTGQPIRLSDVVAKNKYTILEFWASWCGPCRGEIPNLKKAYEKYKSKGLEIYSISIDEKQDKWLKALEEEGTTWINVVDHLGFKGGAPNDYGIRGVPASFLINQDGKIIAVSQDLRGADLDKTLSKYIN